MRRVRGCRRKPRIQAIRSKSVGPEGPPTKDLETSRSVVVWLSGPMRLSIRIDIASHKTPAISLALVDRSR
ncbi:DUF6053 domain-containing protein [Lysobacter capsici]|uniref:DUF6053 domain-containing protein n=1 Tax=Lysobacter capsici TaxID=435897 RepID=UPI003D2F98C9